MEYISWGFVIPFAIVGIIIGLWLEITEDARKVIRKK